MHPTPPSSGAMKVHQVLAAGLKANGIDTIYGLIGDANLFMVDHFIRDLGGRFVAASHEAGAVLMALGHANTSGGLAVATVTHGPALVNTLSPLIEGVRGQLPIVLICGDTPVTRPHHLQNVDQRELILGTGAGFVQLREAATVMEDLAIAIRRAVTERRPVALNVPVEIQWDATDAVPCPCRIPSTRALVPESEDLDNAIGIIAAARRPVIVAGRGAVDPGARAALLLLAERIGAPVCTTLKAKDLFAGEPYNLGVMGTQSEPPAVEVLIEADCLIAFGCGLNEYTTSSGVFTKGKRIVHVHSDVRAIGRYQEVDAALIGDAELTAGKILFWLDEAEIPSSGYRTPDMQRLLADYVLPPVLHPDRLPGTVDIREALVAINAMIPPDRVLVMDGGRFQTEGWRLFPVEHPQRFGLTINFGSIGFGMGEAIGAAMANPGKTTVMITGDGGFMFGGLTEFHAAIHNRLDLVVIVCNDGGYGAEHIQFRNRDMDPSLSLLHWPDLAPVADALGATGVTVRSMDDLQQVADVLANRSGPVLIDLKLDPDCMPDMAH